MKIILNLQHIFFSILVGPVKLVFGFFYTMLFNLIGMPFSLFVLIRSFGFVLNILIISHIFKYIYTIFGINICIYIYIYLIFISISIKFIDKDFKFLKIKRFNLFHSTDFLIFIRNQSTICGLLILSINLYKDKKLSIKYIDIISSHLKMDMEEGFYKY
jgi:hypothetical protein